MHKGHSKLYIYISIYIYIYVYEYYMYQFILLQSCDYLCEISLQANVATDKGNGRNET